MKNIRKWIQLLMCACMAPPLSACRNTPPEVTLKLLAEDGLFSGEAKPQVLIENVREDLGGTQGMLFDFIENVHRTDIELFCDGNWEIVYRP